MLKGIKIGNHLTRLEKATEEMYLADAGEVSAPSAKVEAMTNGICHARESDEVVVLNHPTDSRHLQIDYRDLEYAIRQLLHKKWKSTSSIFPRKVQLAWTSRIIYWILLRRWYYPKELEF